MSSNDIVLRVEHPSFPGIGLVFFYLPHQEIAREAVTAWPKFPRLYKIRSMELKDLLLEFGQKSGLRNLSLDEEGICHLQVNDDFVIWIETAKKPGGFYLYSKIGQVPKIETKEILRRMLEANLYARETLGATLSIDHASDSIIMFRRFECKTVDYQAFEEAIDAFIQVVIQWREGIRDPHQLLGIEEKYKGLKGPWLKI